VAASFFFAGAPVIKTADRLAVWPRILRLWISRIKYSRRKADDPQGPLQTVPGDGKHQRLAQNTQNTINAGFESYADSLTGQAWNAFALID